MGETLPLFEPQFNRSVKIEARSQQISSDAGALVLREYDHRVGLTDWLAGRVEDPRDPGAVVHPQVELVRHHLLLHAQGWVDQDDATQLRDDPVLRLAVSSRRGVSPLEEVDGKPVGLASQPTLSREVATLSSEANRSALRDALVVLAARRLRAAGRLEEEHWLDVDSIGLEVHGHQPGSEYNGHYRCRCYHPLVAVLGDIGDLVGLWLRSGRAHSAAGADERVVELVGKLREHGVRVAGVRMDAGFPSEHLLAALEAADIAYIARIRNNAALDRLAGPMHLLPWLCTPDGSPDVPPLRMKELDYAAGSWSKKRRVVSVVLQEPEELFVRHFHIVTSEPAEVIDAETLLQTYRKRGTAEGHFGQWMSTLSPMLSSANRSKATYRGQVPEKRTAPRDAMACNEVLLLLSALAYGLVHGLRCLLQAATGRGWSLQRVRERALKVGARLLRGKRRATFVIPRGAAELQALLWSQLAAIPPPG